MTSAHGDGKDWERRLLELSDLLEISRTLNQSLELEAILNQLLLASMGRFAVGRGVFLLASDALTHRVALAKGVSGVKQGDEVRLESAVCEPVDATGGDSPSEFFAANKLALLIPLQHASSHVGILALGPKLTGRAYEPAEIEFLRSLANVATPAIENSRVYGELRLVNERLDRKIHELNTVFELGRRFVGTLESDEVLRLFAFALMGQLLLTRYLIVLQRPAGDVVHAKGISIPDAPPWQGPEFWERLAELERAVSIDAGVEPGLAALKLAAIVPIRKDDVTHGFLGLGARPSGGGYTDDELAFAAALANQAIVALENAWLIEETLEKRRLEEELAIASNIQSRLFPKHLPAIPGYDVAARSTPTRHVGGDYYDAIDLGDGFVLIAIADVSGKGVPAALLMSNVQASLRALACRGMDLAGNAAKINDIIYANTDFNKYATFFYGILDTASNLLRYTNAGHNPPMLLRSDGVIETLDAGGLPVGLMPGSVYESGETTLHPGDLLVLYTDGVTEAESSDEEEFGTGRLELLVRETASEAACDVLERIAADVDEFATGMPQADDITMLVLKRAAD